MPSKSKVKPTNPTAIDLFAGVGGLSLGASRAGFDVRLAVEIDKCAISSHQQKLLEEAGLSFGQLDLLIGGPPCQGFSSIGNRDIKDPRNKLFWHFFRLAKETKPKIFIAENVPGILHNQYESTVNTAIMQVVKDYEIYGPQLITASDYGAPTTRTRVFFIGLRRDLKPSDDLWMKPISQTEYVTVGQALRGLPQKIDPNWQIEEQSWQKVHHKIDTPFFDKIVNQVPNGLGCPHALDAIKRCKVSGFLGTRHTADVVARFEKLLPGQRDNISKSLRLDSKQFCPTLRAGTGSDKGSYQAVRPIHPTEPRVITPREASRLQGFPDWFQFHPTKWHAFRQIGNSVSPIVAEHILSKLFKLIS